MADNDRDTLADLLLPLIGGTYTSRETVPAVADAILARWRLVPIVPCALEPGTSMCSNRDPEHRAQFHT